jgi:hypothetical protein
MGSRRRGPFSALAAGALRIEIVRHPADARGLFGTRHPAAAGQRGAQARKAGTLGCAQEAGPQIHHQRRLDSAAMLPMGQFFRLEQARPHAEARVCAPTTSKPW